MSDRSDHIPFAFAGLMMRVPRDWRLTRLDSKGQGGRFMLGDGERIRLELNWNFNTRRKFDPAAFARKRLGKKNAEPVEIPGWQAPHRYSDTKENVDRYVAYRPETNRVIDLTYYLGSNLENRDFATVTLSGLVDQPGDAPWRWAMFDLRFMTPAGFRWRKATLNLGDMRVDLEGDRRASMTVRHIYPAALAFKRRPLDGWRKSLLFDADDLYRPISDTDAKLRFAPGLVRWRIPRLSRARLIHDTQADRLVWVRVAAAREQLDPLIQTVVDGLNWSE